MNYRKLLLVLGCIILCACSSDKTFAQAGIAPVRIPMADSADTHCIDPSRDQIWLTLRRLVLDKSKGFLQEDKNVGIVLNAQISTDPQENKSIAFPLISQADIRSMESGQVSIPIEYAVVRGLALKQDDVRYIGIDFDITIVNTKGRNAWGNALSALAETADKLPLPASPLKDSATYLLDFANKAVTKDLEDQASNDKLKSASLAFNFDPTGRCGDRKNESEFESTGTIALLYASGVQGASLIPIAEINQHCWTAELKPAFVLKATRKEQGLPCDSADYDDKYTAVTNNYVAFYLNALPVPEVLGTVDDEVISNAIRRCAANGVSEENCLSL
jgi:hypothetical protein